jgi:hypothetical protein
VAGDPWRQAEDLVGDGAELDADPLFLHLLHDPRVPGHGIPVADPLRAEQDGVEEVPVRRGTILQRLAAVEQERDLDPRLLAVGLELEELFGEVLKGIGLAVPFLADEIKS